MKKSILVLAILLSGLNLFAQEKLPLKISGQVFMDYFYNVARDTGISSLPNTAMAGTKDMNGLSFRRVNLWLDYDISNSFTSRIRIESDGAANTSDTKFAFFVKDAYLKWKNIIKDQDIIVGIQPTLGYEVSERFWGYRSLEKTQMDLRKILPSRDMAITMRGNLVHDGTMNYGVMFGNNSNLSPETDRYKRFAGIFGMSPVKNLSVTLYGDYKFAAADKNILSGALFVGYSEKEKFTCGLEAVLNSQAKAYTIKGETTPSGLNTLAVSAFARYNITPDIEALARFDMFDPNMHTDATGDSRNFIIIGLGWSPEKNIQIIPNLLLETFESIKTAGLADKTFKSSVTARVTFAYNY